MAGGMSLYLQVQLDTFYKIPSGEDCGLRNLQRAPEKAKNNEEN
jgi:hypothetical protein